MTAWRSRNIVVIFLSLLILVGCTFPGFNLGKGPLVGNSTPEMTAVPTTPGETATPAENATTQPKATPATPQPAVGIMVRVWLPPEFDPRSDNPASQLLQDRLDTFLGQNPEVRLDVRTKALEGEGGLLDSLVATNVAAPIALPDLVLLPRALLESAALKGLLYPYESLSEIMDEPDWYEYARQLARVQTSTYGIPFAGDALILAYHPSLVDIPSTKLDDYLALGKVMLFPVTDPQALFPLGLYMAENGSLQDEQGRPYLDKTLVTNMLAFYQQASVAGMMPYWLTQYSNDQQVWEAFQGEQNPMAVTWTSTYLGAFLTNPADIKLAYVPTLSGTPYSLASGWSWVLAGQDKERREMAVKLAEFLVDSEFLGQWSYAAGYLPPRELSLRQWPNSDLITEINSISNSAALLPPVDMLASLGPPLEKAIVDILKDQGDPQTAAQSVIDEINQP